jgi:branched-subunit amino acid ABC-type transport system permease component
VDLLAVFDLRTVVQLTTNGIINGAAYGLLGVGFALILGVTGRFHFAYGITYTLSAYLIFTAHHRWGIPLWPSVLIGVLLVTLVGMAMEAGIYRSLVRNAGASALLSVFVASLGLGIAGENFLRLFYGSQTNSLTGLKQRPIRLFNNKSIFLNFDLYQVLTAVALVAILTLLLRFTGLGRAIKATRSNPDMARIIGINPNIVYVICFAIGTFFAAVEGFWYGLKYTVEPAMGFNPVIYAFVVAFLAGTARSPLRVFLTGVFVSLVEQLSSIWLSVRWTQTAVFVILVAYLVSLSVDPRKIFRRVLPPRTQAQPAVEA